MDPIHRPNQARTEHDLKQRLTALELRGVTAVVTINAGGSAWNTSNSQWEPATGYPEFTELRVIDTPVGSQIWRAVNDGADLIWVLVVQP